MPPVLPANALEIISHSPEQTRRIGVRLGELLNPGNLVCLHGDLGSGKTTLVQGIARGWGAYDRVSSPTFVLVNTYRRTDEALLFHMDAYRLSGPQEAWSLDLEDYLARGPLLVEWAERIDEALPPERLDIRLTWIADQQRDLLLTAQGSRHTALLTALRKRTFGR